jgi:outer membrane protein TolC
LALYGLAVAALLNGVGCAAPGVGSTCQAQAAPEAAPEGGGAAAVSADQPPPPRGTLTAADLTHPDEVVQAAWTELVPGDAAEPSGPPQVVPPAQAPGSESSPQGQALPDLPQPAPQKAPAPGEPKAAKPKAGVAPEPLPPPRERPSEAGAAGAVVAEAAPGELTLAEAIKLTLDANPDLQSAVERTQIAEEALANARAQFFPTLAFNQEYQVANNPLRKFVFQLEQGVDNPQNLFPLPNAVDIYHAQLHYQHDLYAGGLRLARARAAEAERDAEMCSLQAVRNKLVFQVAEAYYRLFQARALVSVRREAVTQVESELKAVRSRFAANTVVRSDVLRVEVRLAEVREALITSINAQELALAVLENVVGMRLGDRRLPKRLPPAPWSEHVDRAEAAVAAVTAAANGPPGEVEAAVAEAVEHRPELGEVANRKLAAEHRVRAAKAGKYPTVGFVGDYDAFYGDFRSTDSYFFGLAFSLNLFDGGRTKSNVRQAQAQVREICARQQRAKLDVELDVRRAYLQLKDARERQRLTATVVTNAEEALRQVESRFRGESATTTELLDAQVLLSDARVRATSVAADVEIARASLERAVGRLAALLNACPGHHPGEPAGVSRQVPATGRDPEPGWGMVSGPYPRP